MISSDAGATSSSIISLIVPLPMPTQSPAPSLMLSPVSTTSGNLIHRPFADGLLRIERAWRAGDKVYWNGYRGTFLRDTVDGQAEVLIGTKTYLIGRAELALA